MSLRRASVRTRLTAWYAITLLVTFVAALAGVREALSRALEQNATESLVASARLITTFFRVERPEYPSARATLAHVTSEMVLSERHVEFLPPPDDPDTRPLSPATTHDSLLPPISSIELPLDPDVAPGWRVRVFGSFADDHEVMRRMDTLFLALMLLSVVVASLGGWWLAGRALRPVRAMAEAAERITGSQSGGRLPVAPAADEFARLGERFNALLDRLDGALVQQRRFLAEAAHELRTPIARLRGEVELALDPRVPPEDRSEQMERMRDDLADTGRLVDELLQLARADAGGQEVRLAPAFLDDVVVDAVRAWGGEAARRSVALGLSALEEAPVTIDAALVRRLVGILVDNALSYTPPGGMVDVRVRHTGDAALLEVEDTGIGMADAERARAFERFQRGRRAREMNPEGSGLGLAIVEWVAGQHGATVRLEPRPGGGGTLATVRFPVVREVGSPV